jgi:hypothetical protein
MSMPGITDTDEVRAVTRKLTDALYDYLCLSVTAYERAAKAGKIPAYASVAQVPDAATQLAKAVEERDRMQARLDAAMAQLDEVPEQMVAALRMAVVDPMEAFLESQERYISDLQRQMEQTEAAVAQFEQKQST